MNIRRSGRKINSVARTNGDRISSPQVRVNTFHEQRTQNKILVMLRVHPILSQDAVKYLGLYMNSKLVFDDHEYIVTQKADEVTSRLTRIMSNTGGASSHKRKLLASVTKYYDVWRTCEGEAHEPQRMEDTG